MGWTIAYKYAIEGVNNGKKNNAASNATMAFLLMYPAAYNIGYNALTYSKQT